MSSLNQAFIKAYGKDPAAPAPSAAPASNAQQATTVAPSAPAGNMLGSWYSAETWYRAEAAQPAKPSVVPPPHVPFTTGYQAPTTHDLSHLAGHLLSRRVGGEEEIEYRLSPPEAIPAPELVVEEEAVPTTPVTVAVAPVAVPAPVVAPKSVAASASPVATVAVAPAAPVAPPAVVAEPKVATKPSAPVAPNTTQVANAFALHDMFAPVQIGGAWDQNWAILPAMTTIEPTVASKPTVAAPKPTPPVSKAPLAEKPVVEKPVTKPADVATPAPTPVAQMRLDAAAVPPVPKPHVVVAPMVAPKVETPKVELPAPAVVPVVAPVVTAPVAKTVAPPPAPVAPPVPLPAPIVQTAPLAPLQPAWEVDRFQWPDHCRQLMSPENENMADVGQRLAVAAKDGLSILAITSTRRGEGRTTLALCLAKAAAAAGVKVALVDADADNPQLVNELGVEAACGWHEVVLGKQPLSEAAIVSLEDRFTFFPWMTVGALKSLNDPQVTKVLKTIAREHQLVILDLGPAPGRETRMFEDGEHCPIDAVILVRDVRWTSAIEAQRVAGQLITAGVGSVGIAENFGPRS